MTIEKIWIDEQTITEGNAGFYLFKEIQLYDKCQLGFGATIQKIENNLKWINPREPHLKELYLTIECSLSVTIAQARPQPDDLVNIKTKTCFIITGDLEKPTDGSTLKILAQLYTSAAQYNYTRFAADRKRAHKTERFEMLNAKEILKDLEEGVFKEPEVKNTAHTL